MDRIDGKKEGQDRWKRRKARIDGNKEGEDRWKELRTG